MTKNQLIKKAISLMPTAKDMFKQFSSDWTVEKTSSQCSFDYVTAQQNADVTSCKIGKEECLKDGDILWVTVYYGFKATFKDGSTITGELSTEKEMFYVNKLIAA